MTHYKLKSLAIQSIESFNNPKTRELYFSIYHPDCVMHGIDGLDPGLASIKQYYHMIWSAFPDIKVQMEDMIEEGNTLAFRYSVQATHRGEFMGIPATGKPIGISGMSFLRFDGNHCIERWALMDLARLMQQIQD